ncbi:MAG: aminoacyl-tRNA hydrolase [Ruminococcaceae bacterium]|nr:aminoacyl-tRNA hydrolase [Oscillospiraceae bacterium]
MSILDIFARLEKERMEKEVSGKVEYIVAGLGNPGKKYENTRHNAGYMTLDKISSKYGFGIDKVKFKSLVGEGNIGGHRVLFMKPETYMNNSGEALGEAVRFYKIPVEKVIVISDDISLPVGKIRIRRKGSHGGHNGLKSIEAHLGSNTYPRIKMGVGEKPHPDYDLADWVLGKFSAEDKKIFDTSCEKGVGALELILENKFEEAMSKFN